MNRITAFLASAATATAFASAAQADDLDTNGFHIAILTGYTQVEGDLGDDQTSAVGFSVGYEWDRGDYFFGVEGSFQRESYSFSDNVAIVGAVDIPVSSDIFRLMARGGIHRDRFAIYGTIGLTHFFADSLGAPGLGFDPSTDETGYSVGFGTEYYVNEDVFVGFEILRNDYDNIDLVDHDVIARIGYRF